MRTRHEARADGFGSIERFYNLRRRHSKQGYLQPHGVRGPHHAGLARCPHNRQELRP